MGTEIQERATFKLCEYDLKVQDYQQILVWARQLNEDPESIVEKLEDAEYQAYEGDTLKLEIKGSAIVTLVWDFNELPLSDFEWIDDLSIANIVFRNGKGSENLNLNLPALRRLYCSDNNLKQIEFKKTPELRLVDCGENSLTSLPLKNIQKLEILRCNGNKLKALPIEHLEKLTELNYSGNPKLIQPTLNKIPNLKHLACSSLMLKELDLSGLKNLNYLDCHDNKLETINLSHTPNLTWLDCKHNEVTSLNLEQTPKLAGLDCKANILTQINLDYSSEEDFTKKFNPL